MFTAIGDVHGKYGKYIDILKNCHHSVQVGDMGFNYSFFDQIVPRIDSNRHVFFGGNHDNYDKYEDCEYAMGDFGYYMVGDIPFYYIRGERSIDRSYRKIGIDWWSEEEMEYKVLERCIKAYEINKPKIVLSHGCPSSITELVTVGNRYHMLRPSVTSVALQRMLDVHRPNLWIFGHHHRSFEIEIEGTVFRGLNELETFDVTEKWLKQVD
jgi:hypothetical protein